MNPPIIKLMTLWVVDNQYESRKPDSFLITHGIWETRSVEHQNGVRVYGFVCVSSSHKDIKIGDRRKIQEEIILTFCHQVVITHLPKVKYEEVNQQNKILTPEEVADISKNDYLRASIYLLEHGWLKDHSESQLEYCKELVKAYERQHPEGR